MSGCSAPRISFRQMQSANEIADCVQRLKAEFSHLEERIDVTEWCQKLQRYAYSVALMENDDIVGFAAVYVNDLANKEAYLTLIGVDKLHRRKGYGKLLLEHCMEIALQKGMTALRLEVDGDNLVGQAFYRSMGFEKKSLTQRGSFMMTKQIYHIRRGG